MVTGKRGSKTWMNDLANAKELAQNRDEMMLWILAKLLQYGASQEPHGVRALIAASVFPRNFEEPVNLLEKIDADEFRSMAVRFLQGFGYRVVPPDGSGPAKS